MTPPNPTHQRPEEASHATLPAVPIGRGHHHLRSVPDRHLHQLQRPLDPRRQPAADDQPGPRTLAHGPGPLPARLPRALTAQRPAAFWRHAMMTHYQPERLRRNSDRPTAITNVLAATSPSSYRTGDIPLGTPTCSARSRHGLWALYPNGARGVGVGPGGP